MIGNLIIITSPSGGGKGTLIKEILKIVPEIGYSVSYTTREKREGEEHGRDYFFVSKDEFIKLIEQDEFLEYALVHGNYYGTSVNQIYQEIHFGRDVILEIDVQGAENIRAKLPESVAVFIMPPSFEVLRQRLTTRNTETNENLLLRLQNSFVEIAQYEKFDYVVINDEVAAAVGRLQSVICGERQKRIRQTGAIRGILDSFDTANF